MFHGLCHNLWFGPELTLDSGKQVRIGRKLAEGGFLVVFRATAVTNSNALYALKRIQCMDGETRKCVCERKQSPSGCDKNKTTSTTISIVLPSRITLYNAIIRDDIL
jgi:hypothetical protein